MIDSMFFGAVRLKGIIQLIKVIAKLIILFTKKSLK